MFKRLILLCGLSCAILSCSSSDDSPSEPSNPSDDPVASSFTREALLEDWVSNYIEPGYDNLAYKNDALNQMAVQFSNQPSQANLDLVRTAFAEAYIAWQKVAFLDVGPATNNNIRIYFNTYPADANGIQSLMNEDDYLLNLLANRDKQGYPAIDYILNGMTSDESLVSNFSNDDKYADYLQALTTRLDNLSDEVKNDWITYAPNFISNDGSSASASVDKTTNAFLLYYEKFYRNGKVRFPAGYNTGEASPSLLEATYSEDLSKTLFLTATQAMHDFYIGKSFDGTRNELSFEDYLEAEDAIELNTEISGNFDEIYQTANDFNGTFKSVLLNDRNSFLNLHDRIQEAVIPMKTEMMQVMNIATAYQDGDGD